MTLVIHNSKFSSLYIRYGSWGMKDGLTNSAISNDTPLKNIGICI